MNCYIIIINKHKLYKQPHLFTIRFDRVVIIYGCRFRLIKDKQLNDVKENMHNKMGAQAAAESNGKSESKPVNQPQLNAGWVFW